MALNFFMICSGVCRFFFISSLATLRVADSHNIWFLFRGALHYHRWKRELGMLELNQAKQLKELQRENNRLKRMLADEMLGKELLKEVLEKKL